MSAQANAAGELPSVEVPESARSFVKRWKHKNLFDRGFLVVPTLFLHHYAHLTPYPLTPGEALFVLHLMEFKWDAKAPFPGYKTLAARMGISDKMTRRYAQGLEAKKYLQREMRVGQTNRFDLTPLFDALSKAVDQEKKRRSKPTRKNNKERRDALLAWYEKMVETHRLLSDEEKKDLAEWDRTKVDGSGKVGTSDWPGWEKYLGKKPA
jgi:hypothetical protein